MTQKTNERFFMFVETGSVVTLSQLVQLKRTYDVKPRTGLRLRSKAACERACLRQRGSRLTQIRASLPNSADHKSRGICMRQPPLSSAPFN